MVGFINEIFTIRESKITDVQKIPPSGTPQGASFIQIASPRIFFCPTEE